MCRKGDLLQTSTELPLPKVFNEILNEFLFFENPRLPVAAQLAQYVLSTYPAPQRARQTPGGVYTLGYQSRDFDSYIGTLLDSSIDTLVDVRYNPYSQKALFSRQDFIRHLPKFNIRYQHIKSLGIPGTLRKSGLSKTQLFEYYQRNLANHEAELIAIDNLSRAHCNVALTCFERQPQDCHRQHLAQQLKKDHGLEIFHL